MSSSWTAEVEAKASPAKLFKAIFLEWHHLGPKIVPHSIASIVNISGDGGPGSLRQTNFTPVVPFSFVKEKLEFIDHDKLEVKVSLVEGGDLGKKIECASSHFKIEAKGSGAVVKAVGTFKAIGGVDVADDIIRAKESFIEIVKGVDGYLAANPTACA
ncbi:Pathogenesis-related protein 1 [Apostasia shenzhenica]|uniref:Pathogenesis-related protein 1 n=1 Tax=Apostasia shenzhenica TaxID=1088818 RepID=A0A2I0B352_9ASPA|nr:Pathogenesis-related protein 1 [Apostasia shenzhenica]